MFNPQTALRFAFLDEGILALLAIPACAAPASRFLISGSWIDRQLLIAIFLESLHALIVIPENPVYAAAVLAVLGPRSWVSRCHSENRLLVCDRKSDCLRPIGDTSKNPWKPDHWE